jgi:hypothetical protein
MPTRVILYEDPTDDGDPSDAVYLTQATTYVENPNTDIFTTVPIYPTQVSGVFFVAALFPNQAAGPAYYPAAIDQTTSSGNSWLVGSTTFGGFDIYNLSAPVNDVTLTTVSGNWLLRAQGVSTPPIVPLAPVWIAIAAAGISIIAFFKYRRR